MKKLLFSLIALTFCAVVSSYAQQKKYAMYAMGFYNLENLCDT